MSASAFKEECSMQTNMLPTEASNMFVHIDDAHQDMSLTERSPLTSGKSSERAVNACINPEQITHHNPAKPTESSIRYTHIRLETTIDLFHNHLQHSHIKICPLPHGVCCGILMCLLPSTQTVVQQNSIQKKRREAIPRKRYEIWQA